MALDRVVRFPEVAPNSRELRILCTDYLGASGMVITRDGRLFLDVPGVNSFAHRRVGLCPKAHRAMAEESWKEYAENPPHKFYNSQRWIEVFLHPADEEGPACVYVTTRQHDEFTNAIAEGLADVLMRGWRGEREPR